MRQISRYLQIKNRAAIMGVDRQIQDIILQYWGDTIPAALEEGKSNRESEPLAIRNPYWKPINRNCF